MQAVISEQEYSKISDENENHGRVFFTDLYIKEAYKARIELLRLPPGVMRDRDFARMGYKAIRREVASDVEEKLHDRKLHYETIVDDQKRILQLIKCFDDSSTEPLNEISSHYHTNSLRYGDWRSTQILGVDFRSFDDALEALKEKSTIYTGEASLTPIQLRYHTDINDFSRSMFKAFTRGFRDKAQALGKEDIAERVDQILAALV